MHSDLFAPARWPMLKGGSGSESNPELPEGDLCIRSVGAAHVQTYGRLAQAGSADPAA
jgi:hypothetical protein